LLIAIVGTPSSLEESLDRFRVAWVVAAVASLASAAISSLHRQPADDRAIEVVLVPADAA
jgi:hypothetical protein